MKFEFYIDGKFDHTTDKCYSVYAPADLREIASVPDASSKDVDNAVLAAKRAFYDVWKYYSGEEKEKLLLTMAGILVRRAAEMGKILGLELGKSSKDCADDIRGSASMVRFYAGLCTKLYGDVLDAGFSSMNYVIKQPFGAVGCMPPWNAPFTGAIQKIAPALVAGNTVVLKASDEAPLATLMLGQVIEEAGFPKGVVNIICGMGPETGKTMVNHPDLKLISFTGSVNVGKKIMASAADGLKRVVLELGGKSPFIVFDDSDLDKAAKYAADFSFVFQGQLCCAASRILIQNTVKEKFLRKYLDNINEFKPGYPEDKLTDPLAKIGPLFNEKQYQRIEEYVKYGKENGRLLTGGKRILEGKFSKGFYYEPTVFDMNDSSLRICREEIFGPVVAVIGFDEEQEAVKIANDVDFGLSSSVWTRDIGRIQRMTKNIEAGTVWVNEYMQFSNSSPWGGFKASGIGREYGIYALNSYFDYKNIWINSAQS